MKRRCSCIDILQCGVSAIRAAMAVLSVLVAGSLGEMRVRLFQRSHDLKEAFGNRFYAALTLDFLEDSRGSIEIQQWFISSVEIL